MVLTIAQTQLLASLRMAVANMPSRNVVLVYEWLGYLPFGLYRWLEIDGHCVSNDLLPDDWSGDDVRSLEKAGLLKKVSDWQAPEDSCHTKTTYEVLPA